MKLSHALIKEIRQDRRRDEITIVGSREFRFVTGIPQITFGKCGRRKAERLFMERYFMAMNEPMRKKDPELAHQLYMADEINWKGYKALGGGKR